MGPHGDACGVPRELRGGPLRPGLRSAVEAAWRVLQNAATPEDVRLVAREFLGMVDLLAHEPGRPA
jgi:hypothetical protein